jgi:serine/threonine protein kinase
MDSEAESRIKEIFLTALDKPEGSEREAYLAQACGRDASWRDRVTELLRVHAQAGDFLETPVSGAAELAAITPTGPTEKPGDKIGHYKLLEQIGEGGCGVVYMAEQEAPLRRRVALKVIKLGMDTRQVVARFEAERQALALMDHPNIARVLDAGATETGRPYFVMELVRGVKVTEYCDEEQLSTEARLNLFIEVCHAIQHAHQKGIIHRDLKPSNILVTVNDGVPVPKVIDFGVAKAIGQQLTDKTIVTAFEQFIGTPAYMSPEQAVMTSLDVDTRSDIYSLGVLLYELLTGHTPFEQKELVAAGLDEMRKTIREREPLRPSTRLSRLLKAEQTTVAQRRQAQPPQLIHLVRGDLDWIVMKCLEKNRGRRYETANELAEDVARHLGDEPVSARPPGRVYRLHKLVRRNKLLFAAGAAVLAALLIGLGLSTWLFFREQSARRRAVWAEQVETLSLERAVAEANKSRQVSQFFKDMLEGVGPSVAKGRDTTLLKEILDKTAERVGRELKDHPETEAELRYTLGNVYLAMGQKPNAEAMHRRALYIRRGLWGGLNTNVANSLEGLASALNWPGAADRAEPFCQEALSIRSKLLGPEHLQVASSLVSLGYLRILQGREWEAEDPLRRGLAIRRKLLGNDNVEVVDALTKLCLCLCREGRPAEAETFGREAVAIQTRIAGSAPDLVKTTAQFRLASALQLQDKFPEAEVLNRQCLESFRTLLNPEHTLAIQGLSDLAMVLAGNGKLEEALTLAREGAAASKRVFGNRYPTPFCVHCLGRVLQKAGNLAEAEAAYQEALLLWEQLPNRFLDEALTRSKLIAVLRKQGKLSELEAFFRENVTAQRKLATKDARYREADLLLGWGTFLCDQGRLAEAEGMYREGLDLCRIWEPGEVGLRQSLASGLREVLIRQGRVAEAESVYQEALTNRSAL